jgi:putative salt-induced outer membrane protein YdiY
MRRWTAYHHLSGKAAELRCFAVAVTLIGLVLVVQGCGVKREVSDRPAVTESSLPDLNWATPDNTFDWIQLKSGEWLKGQFKAVQDRQIEFESEELNTLTFNWEDIRQLRSPHLIDVLFADETRVSGPVTVTLKEVRVGGAEPVVFPRDELQSLTPGGSKERNYWSGKGSVGLDVRGGNSKAVDHNAQAHLQRRTPATRLSLDYIGNISSNAGIENANNNRVNSAFDLWLSRRFYLIIPSFEYYRDPFKNLSGRTTVGAGIGYDIVDRSNLNWNISAGPAYQHAAFDSVQPGEAASKAGAALNFGSRLDWDITHRIDLIMEYRGQFTSREIGETTHYSLNTLSIELTKRFDLDVSFVWNRIAQPKFDENGVQPKPDDYQMIVGVGIDF